MSAARAAMGRGAPERNQITAVSHVQALDPVVRQAGELLATVIGQDLDADEAGMLRIARRVAKDRVISTVDPQARHGHKTAARGFDGYNVYGGSMPEEVDTLAAKDEDGTVAVMVWRRTDDQYQGRRPRPRST